MRERPPNTESQVLRRLVRERETQDVARHDARHIDQDDEEQYQAAVRALLAELIALKRELNETEVYRPNPTANCFWCDFKSLCPLFPEGQPVFDEAAAR